jgi:hypothetical protein
MTQLPLLNRTCGDCTRCCEGWLAGDIRGHKMYPGKNCYFLEIGKGCKEYEDRPQHPCKNFECEWLINERVPLALKPSVVGSIFVKKDINSIEYLLLVEAGRKMDSDVLSWGISYCLSNNINFCWHVSDKIFWIGSEDFDAEMEKLYPNKNMYKKIKDKKV